MDSLKKFVTIEKEANDFGFSWPNAPQILEQIRSECKEVEELLKQPEGRERLQEEIGDLIHAVLSLCIFYSFDPHETLEKSTHKFQKRLVETIRLAQEEGYISFKDQPISLLMRFWNQAKENVG